MDDTTTIGEAATPLPDNEEQPLLFLHGICRHFSQGEQRLDILEGRRACGVARTVGGAGRAVGLRQIDALAYRGPSRTSQCRRSLYRRGGDLAAQRRATHPDPAHRDRLRLSVSSSAAGILGAGKRHPAADDPRPVAARGDVAERRIADPISASRTGSRIGRRNSPAASSSVSPSRARSPMRRAFFSPTSRPAISMCTPPSMCSPRSVNWCAPRVSPPSSPRTTWISRRRWTAA